VDEAAIELESLRPLVRLGPCEATFQDGRWELRDVGPAVGAAGAAEILQR
jgi:hypothetical protein